MSHRCRVPAVVIPLTALVLSVLACGPTETPEAPAETPPPAAAAKKLASQELGHTGITRDLDGTPVRGEYTMKIQVGTPPQDFEVVMDSGSSNLILLGDASLCDNCGSETGNNYAPSASSTSHVTETPIQIQYGSGQLDAVEASDVVAVAGSPSFTYSFGVMTHDANVPNILGLAYEAIAQPQGQPLPTFFATLVEKAGIEDVFAMKLCGPARGGNIEFGGWSVEPTTFMPVVEEAWYVVAPDHLGVKGSETNLGSFDGVQTIVDSGTTELIVTQEMYQGIVDAVSRAAKEAGISFGPLQGGGHAIEGEPGDLSDLPTFQVVAGENAYDVAPSTYLTRIGQESGEVVYMLAVAAQNQAILGQVFMENYYTVFDRKNQRVGFAPIAGLCG